MKNRFLFALTLSVVSTAPLPAAFAAPARAPQGTFLDFYDRLPGKHFSVFGGVNRRSLLKRKGAVVDYQNKWIHIPGSANPRNGDLQALQIKLFPGPANVSWLGVSRVVWNQNRRPGMLTFYVANSDSDNWELDEVSEDFFPYSLDRTGGGYENAYFPRRGQSILIRVPQVDSIIYRFTFSLKGGDDLNPKNPWIRTLVKGS